MADQPTPTPTDPYPNAETLLRGVMDDWDEDMPEVSEEVQPEPQASDDEDSDIPDPVAPKAEATGDADKARNYARLKGWDESVIAKFDDKEISAWHANQTKSKDLADQLLQDRAELRRELEALKAAKSAEPAVPAAIEDPELEAILTRELGLEAGKTVAAKLAARDALTSQKVQALESVLEQRATDAAWNAVRDRLGIKDETTKELVVEQARALSELKSGPWKSLKGDAAMVSIFTAAARLVDPDLPSDAEIRRRAVREEARRNGSPTAAPQRAAPKVPKTPEEIHDARLREIIFKGATDPAKLRRIGT